MSLLDIVRTAFRGLETNKLRAALSTLGILVGIASIIAMLALGNGARVAVEQSFRFLGSDNVALAAKHELDDGELVPVGEILSFKDFETMMGCLAAAAVHHVAWEILAECADDFLAVPDAAAIEMMRRLAEGGDGDPPIAAGESGVAGLAGLWAVAGDEAARAALGLDRGSRVLVIGSEGANDTEAFARIVGRRPEEISRGDSMNRAMTGGAQ